MKKGSNKISFILYTIASIIMVGCMVLSITTFLNFRSLGIQLDEFEKNRGTLNNIIKSMEEIKAYYDKYYIGELPDNAQLEDYALLGFALGYEDKYGAYSSPSESVENTLEQEEKLYGIGVEVVYETGKGLYVAKVYDGGPADKAGIKPGDYIVEADGIKATDVSAQEFISLIKGEKGTSVNLVTESGLSVDNAEKSEEVSNENTETFEGLPNKDTETSEGLPDKDEEVGKEDENKTDLSIERDEVSTNSVDAKVIDGALYLKISKFTNYTDEEFKDAIDNYINSNSNRKIIIDLRNNSGGMADTVIDMVDYIVPSGLIAKFTGKEPSMNKEYYSDANEIDAEIAVLVNENSASASELFTKALQDYGKATVVGKNTFGKGTVISTFRMRNGGTITLSTAEYRTKSNEKIEGVGVIPDVEVDIQEDEKKTFYKLPLEEDEQFQKAMELLK